jgi:succinoglycan biosynthesis transport protein ExoP
MSENGNLAPLRSGAATNLARGTVDIERADSLAYLRANWDVLVKHRLLVVAIAFVLTALVTLYSFKTQPVYQATAVVEVDAEVPFIQTLNDLFRNGSGDDSTFLSTQVGVLQSGTLAWQTIQQLDLGKLPEFGGAAARQSEVIGTPDSARIALVRAFKSRLRVQNRKDTRILEVSFESNSPSVAASTVNALIHNYIEYNISTKYDATRQATGWMERQLEELKVKVEKSQQALVDYERQNNMVNIGDKQSVADSRLQDLTKDLTAAQIERLQKESLYSVVRSDDSQMGFLAGPGSVLANLQSKEVELSEQYADAVTHYGPNYPAVVRLAERLKQLDSLIGTARKRAVEGVRRDYGAAQARERLLERAVTEGKTEVGRMNQLSIQYNLLKREFETNQQLYQSLLERLKDANVSAGLRATNIHLIDKADAPNGPIRPNKTRNVGFGLAAGLILGIALAFAREAVDNTVKGAWEVEKLVSAPALAIIPMSGTVRRRPSYRFPFLRKSPGQRVNNNRFVELAVMTDPNSAVAEAFRTLRTSILLSTAERPPQILLVTSAQPNEGKTSTTTNLAFTLAQKGSRVLMVDTDLRRPGIAKLLGLSSGKGLSSVLTGASEVRDAVVRVEDFPNLWVMTSGPLPPNPAELLCSPRMESVLREMREDYDHVVLDSPPVLPITDATILSNMVDGVIMVVESEGTTRAALARAWNVIELSGGKLLGAVLNKVDARRDGYYGHYYYYGYYSNRYGKYLKKESGNGHE